MKKQKTIAKMLAGTAAAAVMCAALPLMTGTAAQTLGGDVTQDGSVDVLDVISFSRYLHGQSQLDRKGLENADMNKDGTADVFDMALLKRAVISSGSETTDPTEEPTENTTEEMTENPSENPTEPVTEAPVSGTDIVAAIAFDSAGVTLSDAEGGIVSPENASNVTVNGTYVTIIKAGTYAVTGSCENGQIKVSTDNTAEPDAEVELSLEGVTLSNPTAAPIYVENVGSEAVVTIKNNTENTLSDGTSHTDTYVNTDGETKTINAVIFARDDLKIKGKGTLIVNANTEDGIVSANDLKIWNGNLQVNAADDGIRADTVRIGDPDDAVSAGGKGYENLNISITTQAGDGIKAESSDTGKGYVTVNGGTININAYSDGIQAEQNVTINDGDITVKTYTGSGYTGSSSSASTGQMGGMDGNTNKSDASAKAIKATGLYDASGSTWQSEGNIYITGGTISIDSSDDAVHCGGSMSVTGGRFTIATADDALHSDHELTIGTKGAGTFDDVVINVTKCYEGVEAATIIQNSGTVYIVSGDDGYNAAGGSDGSGSGNQNPWGGGSMSTSSGSLTLNGGLVVVNSASGDHDAFDSNGSFTVTGGYYCANGQEPMDYDGTFSNNGGSFITMTAGNTNLNTRYSFVDQSGSVIVSFLSGSGSPGATCTNCTAQSGGTISGGTELISGNVIAGGSLSGGTQITAGTSSGGNQPGGRG